MGFRFRRRIKIAPGIHLNLSRSGISTSLGVRGASMTVGKRGTTANVGIPGSGLSYTTRLGGKKRRGAAPTPTTADANLFDMPPVSPAPADTPPPVRTRRLPTWAIVALTVLATLGAVALF